MKSVFVRYLFPLLAIVSIALIACYYFISFITSNNIEIAKDKFKIFNKEKQREQVIRNQINEIKIADDNTQAMKLGAILGKLPKFEEAKKS